MEPKRKETIRGMPAAEPERESHERVSPLRRQSGTVRTDQAHTKVLRRPSDPYRISDPEHHDRVVLPSRDAEAERRKRRRQLAALETGPMSAPRRRSRRDDDAAR